MHDDDISTPDSDANPRSPLRTVQVLHELAVAGEGVRLADLATRLALPKTSLFRLLRALEQGGYVTSANGVHEVGPQAIRLGAALVHNRGFPNGARAAMEWLAAQCNETVILGTFDDSRTQIVYADVIEPSNPLRFSIKPGLTKPLYSSAIGQTLLAWMPPEQRARYLETVKLQRLASGTVQSVTALKRRLKEIRATGVAVSVDGMFDGVYSIAMPVFDAAGEVPAGLSISAPSTRGERHEERFAALLTRAGEDVSRVLGFNGTYPPLQDQHSTALWKARTP